MTQRQTDYATCVAIVRILITVLCIAILPEIIGAYSYVISQTSPIYDGEIQRIFFWTFRILGVVFYCAIVVTALL